MDGVGMRSVWKTRVSAVHPSSRSTVSLPGSDRCRREHCWMPRISSFFGIVISMYWNEGAHQVPHFHARYGDDEASVTFAGAIIEGSLPARSARLVREWALLHQAELEHNWELARDRQPLDEIDPLA